MMRFSRSFLLSVLFILELINVAAAHGVVDEVKIQQAQGKFTGSTKLVEGLQIPLRSSGGEPKFLKWHSMVGLPANVLILVYNSGEAGTSTIYQIHRAAVIDKNSKKILGDFAFAYIPVGHKKTVPQPNWSVNGKKLLIKDSFMDSDNEVSLE